MTPREETDFDVECVIGRVFVTVFGGGEDRQMESGRGYVTHDDCKSIVAALAAAGYEIKPKQPDHEELREKIAEANAAATWGEPLEQLDEHERDGCFVHADRILALLPDMGNPISEQNQALAGPVMPETPSNAVFPLLRQWLCEDEDWHDGSRMAFWAELRDALMKEQAGE